MASKQEAASLYEIKITLMDLTPAIWRRVTVPRDITLGKLHDVIQIAHRLIAGYRKSRYKAG